MAESARLKFAVCPRILWGSGRRFPQLFESESEAMEFLNSGTPPDPLEPEVKAAGSGIDEVQAPKAKYRARRSYKGPEVADKIGSDGLDSPAAPLQPRLVLNRDQGWENPVPIRRTTDYSGPRCNRTLRDFFPAEEVGPMPAVSLHEDIMRSLEGKSDKYTCYLAPSWRFNEIADDASKRVGHEYIGRRHDSIGEIVVKAVHDVESAFREFHPDAPCTAVADFWSSWQVQRDLVDFCFVLAGSEPALEHAGKNQNEATEQAMRARVYVYRQLAAFAHEVREGGYPQANQDGATEPSGDDSAGPQAEPAVNGANGNRENLSAPSWDSIEISFLSDHRVQIRNGTSTETLNYGEFGFADRRAKQGAPKPNRAWEMLRTMAEHKGIILNATQAGAPWEKVEKRMQDIRKALRHHFRISADPIPFVKGTGYQACFKIGCSPSYNT